MKEVKNDSTKVNSAQASSIKTLKNKEVAGKILKPGKTNQIKSLEKQLKEFKAQNKKLQLENEKVYFELSKKIEIDNLNEILLSSLQHPAMYIRRKDRVVISANKIALQLGVKPGGYCWREFGNSEYISEKNKKIAAEYPDEVPSKYHIKCTFCQGDECFSSQPEQNNPEVHAFGLIWNTYWIKVSEEVYLHYAINITEKKLAEEALHRSDSLLRNTEMLTKSGGWEWDIQKKTMFWTEETYKIHDYAPNLKSKKNQDLIDLSLGCYQPEDRKIILDAFHQCINEGISYDMEFQFTSLKGRKIWIRTKAQAIYHNGKIEKVIGFIGDISIQKNTEEVLKEITEQFQTLADLSPAGIYLTDTEGNCIYVNPSWCEMAGLSLKEARGLGWLQGIYLEDRDMVFSNWKRMVESKGKWGFEYRFQNKEGKITIVFGLASPQFDSNGQIFRYIGVNIDITERKDTERILKESELRLASLVRILQNKTNSIQELLDFTLEEAIKITNSTIGYIYFYSEENKEFTLFSWSKQVMHQCTIMNPKTLYKLEETGIWGEAVRQRKPILVNDFNSPNSLKKGYPEGHAHLDKYLTIPVFFDDKIVAVIGVANKITDYVETDILHLTLLMDGTWKEYEKININELVKQQNEELVKINADKDQFMSILAHDLKSSFNGLLGLSDVLLGNIKNFDLNKIEHFASLINKAARSSYNLLEDLLLWTRTQSGRIPFAPEKLNLFNLTHEVVDDLCINTQSKNLTISILLKKNETLFADPDMLKTVLRNLISNAIKFTMPGGKIAISCKSEKHTKIVSVEDSGIGISQETISRLFDNSQIYTTRGTAEEVGTGLGLLLCKDFVEKHLGEISIESKIGKGSKFNFSIPEQ